MDAPKKGKNAKAANRAASGKAAKSSSRKPTKKKPTKKKVTKKKVTKKKVTKRKPAGKNVSRKVARKKRSKKPAESFFKPLTAREKTSHRPLTAALVKRNEKRYGVKFPQSLLALLKEQNGGEVATPEFAFGRKSYDLPEIPPLRESGGLEPLTEGYPDHVESVAGQLTDPHLIFPLHGDGHFFIALDYRVRGGAGEPRVIYLDIEGKVWWKQITDTFADFLAGQCPPEEKPKVRVDLADPDAQIGYVERTKVNPLNQQVETRQWLFLGQKLVELFEYSCWRKRVGKDKWANKPFSEHWQRSYVKLQDITSVATGTLNRQRYLGVDTSPAKMGVYYDESSRENGKGWKNRSGGPIIYFHFQGKPKSLIECRDKINEMLDRRKR